MLVLGGTVVATSAFAGIAPAANATTGGSCVRAAEATFQHTFDGPAGTATITAVRPLCNGEQQDFSLVSYTAPARNYAVPQFAYDTDRARIDSGHRSVRLEVGVPGCHTQVDTIFGTSIRNEITTGTTPYGDAKLGSTSGLGSRSSGVRAWYNGGSGTCSPKPSVSFRSDCAGNLHTRLANAAGANVDATFTVDGRLVRVRAGAFHEFVSRKPAVVEVRDNSFTTSRGAWSKPSDCAEAPTPGPTTVTPTARPTTAPPAAPSTAPTTTPTTAPAASPTSAVPTASESPAAAPTASAAPTVPATTPVPDATPDDRLPATGADSVSLALYAGGALLIGTGLLFAGRQVRRGRHSA
ncbi:LPXTG cell wall anchor domain-containing protein [Actinoplanes sp. NEAU-A12]|uniref:LPXTG cell wall anchor domain-containing protein n=1 Tax=Actinoplanes sandaracinus TaxID=3045177 RepID=A0ABT6WVR3_9ACTN|nr:LPXTG cell wall anchor domain-containing protein [Actinoplanes sandaracinus]MDI6103815.1 LPXTG cell wall anchor domain-containing protein [Actinoplanes sandaracinus]